jgi:hypothetical protein
MLSNKDKYIFINENSLSDELCNEIIELFEKEPLKHDGTTHGGLNKNIKDTTDYVIKYNNDKWKDILNFLDDELTRNINKYFSELLNTDIYKLSGENSPEKFNFFSNASLCHAGFLIQKYEKNKGRYIYHNDSEISKKNNKYRILTFIWYLNSIIEGGETGFHADEILIKPTIGKLILFPATWTYPHRGKIPISDPKYIITGWVHVDINFD